MRVNKMTLRLIMIILLMLPMFVFAGPGAQPTGIGQMADMMMEPVYIFSDFVDIACYIIGGSFMFAAIIKYMEHRVNPLMVPFSSIVYLIMTGGALLLLPFAGYLTDIANH